VLHVLASPHFVVGAGRLIIGPDGRPLPDDAPVRHTIERMLRISERRPKLHELDPPVRRHQCDHRGHDRRGDRPI